MLPTGRLTTVAFCLAMWGVPGAPAIAADVEAGADLATQCSACHGAAGISTGGNFPNLAAQKEDYIASQLRAFRADERSNALMNAVAASLSDTDIDNLAAHFASLPGAEPGAVAANVSGLDGTAPEFPADFESAFTRYHRIDFEDRKQVRHYSANDVALTAAKSGGPLPAGSYLLVEIFKAQADADGTLIRGADGQLVAGDRSAFTAMQKQAGWGEAVPEILRNGDWRYSVFSAEGQHRPGLNEGPCLACHQPLADIDYTFTYDTLREFALAN